MQRDIENTSKASMQRDIENTSSYSFHLSSHSIIEKSIDENMSMEHILSDDEEILFKNSQ